MFIARRAGALFPAALMVVILGSGQRHSEEDIMANGNRTRDARAVVTGAGSGIGRAFARELAARGGQVVCGDINLAAAAETARGIEAAGGQALAVHCDVAAAESVGELAAAADSWFGPPTLVVNNAGLGAGGHFIGDGPLGDWRRALDVNLYGAIHGCHIFTPVLRAAGAGGIINVASAAAFAAVPGMGPYNVGKAGVLSLSETLSAELQGTPIVVTVLCPTFVPTNIFDGELLNEFAASEGKRLAAKSRMTAEQVALAALDAHDRGRLYALPQLDAKIVWRFKRFFPVRYARTVGRAVKAPGTPATS